MTHLIVGCFQWICWEFSENPTCLVCIARRVPMTEKVNAMLGVDQFTTKQDLQGTILAADVRLVCLLVLAWSVCVCTQVHVCVCACVCACVCLLMLAWSPGQCVCV